jgi:hypothetical protein
MGDGPNKLLGIELPDTMSDLLLFALSDLDRVEQVPGYHVNMSTWHEPREGVENLLPPVCSVCLAGAVMCRALTAKQAYNPHDFDAETNLKFEVLDYLRIGAVHLACELWVDIEEIPPLSDLYPLARDITPYHKDKDRFKADLRQLAADLKKAGA